MYVGEYEKVFTKFQEGDDPQHAEYKALYGETHNTDKAPSYDEWLAQEPDTQWWDDDMLYEVYVGEPLTRNQINVISEITHFCD